jgi:hypothetical protein
MIVAWVGTQRRPRLAPRLREGFLAVAYDTVGVSLRIGAQTNSVFPTWLICLE